MAHIETVELHHQAPSHFLLRLSNQQNKNNNDENNRDEDDENSSAIRVVALSHQSAGGDDLVRNCIFPLLLRQKTLRVIIGHQNQFGALTEDGAAAASSSSIKFAPASLDLQHLTSDLYSIQDQELRNVLTLLFRKQCVLSLGAVVVAKVTKVINAESTNKSQKALALKIGTGGVQAVAAFPVSKTLEGNVAVIKPFGTMDEDDEENNNNNEDGLFHEDIEPSNNNNNNKTKGVANNSTVSNKNKTTIAHSDDDDNDDADQGNKRGQQQQSVDVGDSVSARILYVGSTNGAPVACSVSEKIVNRAPMNRRELADAFLHHPATIGAGNEVTATILLHCSSEEAFGIESHLAVGEVIINNNTNNTNNNNSISSSSILVYIRMGSIKKAPTIREKFPVRSQVQVILQYVPNAAMLDALPFCIGQVKNEVKSFLQIAAFPSKPLIPKYCLKVSAEETNNNRLLKTIFKPLIASVKFQHFCDPLFVDHKEQLKEQQRDENGDQDEDGQANKSRIRRRELEEAIDAFERQGEVVPTTADGFKKLLLSAPQSSYIWIRYMAFLVSISKVDEAKDIAEQALRTINARDTSSERLNIFTAYMNLENLHGTAESLTAIFNRALAHTDSQLSVYERLTHIFRATKKKDQLLQLCRTMTGKFAGEARVWELLAFAYIDQDKREALRRTLRQVQAHTSLKVADKTLILQHVAVHEYKTMNPVHGRALFETLVSQKAKRSDVWNVFLDQEMAMLARQDPSTSVTDVRKLFQRASAVQLPPRSMQQLMSRFLKYEQQHGTSADVERVKEAAQKYVQDRLAAASSGVQQQQDFGVPAGFGDANKKGSFLEDTTNELLGQDDDDDDNQVDGGAFNKL